MDWMVGCDECVGMLREVCGGYGVPHLIFELRLSRGQRDGCVVMGILQLDPSSEAADFGRGRAVRARDMFGGCAGDG